ncbi:MULTISPECIES: S41 family peptidase [Galbibacter]|uniref:S41 family peptidase n=1 Tax=Galbibacter pacificus TaxID=2996052 RepID=A0ABT6FS30_9FLAO|nr:S41 family peptidase [Galbibacter pacificus]MDG3582975.1 S41 family peptidase [Galbibacter pacificus]MDG3585906.1 S41 family peptidase [Galbibacter pacificus]
MKKKIIIPALAIVVLLIGTGFKNDFFEIAKQVEIFTTMFKELNMNYVDETNPAELMDTAIKSMLEDLDPYTRFMNEQDVEGFKISNAGEYSGIGAVVKSYHDKLLIIEPYKGYPADKAGLKAGDEIIKIGDINVSDFKDDATELLKGATKSNVEITYLRQGKTMTTSVSREEIEIDAVPYYKMINPETGYIVLSKFNSKASKQTENALEDLKGQGAKKIVLDLRGNPGGLLTEAINVCNLFVPKKELIVSTKSKVKKFNQQYFTRKNPVDTEIPLVILINGRSASASEIVSGALQDLDRAVVVGARSFGKGLVQRPIRLNYGTQLKVTISRYYTPSGRCIQSMDYWNRDENGQAIVKKNFNEFKTRNGRKVYDSGGVMPDIEIPHLKNNSITNALLENNVVFDYATKYYYGHDIKNLTDFNFSESDYQNFKNYVTQSGFNYETKTEKALKKVIESDEIEEFGASVKDDYQKLMSDIEKSKLASLDEYRQSISKNIEDELIVRYFYRDGLYDYYLQNDEAIKAAKDVLKDNNKYKSILK